MRFSWSQIFFNSSCTLLLLLTLMSAAPAATSVQQQRCPDIEISGPTGRIDRSKPLHFVALAGNLANDQVTYNWSVSVPTQIKKSGEEPDEVDIDLRNFPDQKVIVTVEINGLPEGCPKIAVYELDEPHDLPVESPTFMTPRIARAMPPEVEAPTLSLNCPVTVDEGEPLYVNVSLDGLDLLNTKPTYNWKVSPASIISGQSTPTIKVETKGQGNQIIRAKLSVEGYGLLYTVYCSTMVKAAPYAYKLDEFRSALSFDEKELRLRRFLLRLRADLNERAYIIAYGKKDEAKAEALLVRRYLVEEHAIDDARVVVIDGGRRKEASIELWVVQPGAPLPFSR